MTADKASGLLVNPVIVPGSVITMSGPSLGLQQSHTFTITVQGILVGLSGSNITWTFSRVALSTAYAVGVLVIPGDTITARKSSDPNTSNTPSLKIQPFTITASTEDDNEET